MAATNRPSPSKPEIVSSEQRSDVPKVEAPAFRAVLFWCLPALLVGLTLRIWYCRTQPYASYNSDALDFLQTAVDARNGSGFAIHWKRTFLTPVVYWLFSLSGAPLALTIPIFQHLLGCVMIVLIGWLSARLFHFWKIAVPLLTLLFAVNPSFLFYEHQLMAETLFGFCLIAMALAAACYARSRSASSLVVIAASVFLAVGARPEGKFFALFPLLLIAWTEWRRWKKLAVGCAAVLAALAFAAFFNPRGNEGGAMLLASVIHLTPDEIKGAPGLSPMLEPLKSRAFGDWKKFDENGLRISPNWHATIRKALLDIGAAYLHAGTLASAEKFARVNRLLFRAGKQACLEHPLAAVGVAVKKAMSTINELPALVANADQLRGKHETVLTNDAPSPAYSGFLFGTELKTPEEIHEFVTRHYPPEIRWYNDLRAAWRTALNKNLLPKKTWHFAGVLWPGIPLLYLCAAAGMIVSAFRKTPLRPWCASLTITLMLMSGLLFLTGNVRVRYRYFLEPFWPIYAALLFDFAAAKIPTLFRNRRIVA